MSPRSPIRFAAACAFAFACQAAADLDVPMSSIPNPDAEVAVAAAKAGDWQRAEARILLGECLLGLGRATEAEPLLRDGHRALREARGAPSYLLSRSIPAPVP